MKKILKRKTRQQLHILKLMTTKLSLQKNGMTALFEPTGKRNFFLNLSNKIF